jgi:hypothetical protein
MAKYIALALGIRDNRRVKPGQTFEGPEGLKATWFTPAVEVSEKKTVAAKSGKGETLGLPTKPAASKDVV